MCGIAGFITSSPVHDPAAMLEAMATSIAHRGPDDSGFLHAVCRDGFTRVGLAHRRLAIIDLASGNQPIGNEDGSVQIVFNGEIYNFHELRAQLIGHGHAFSTHSDTETIVHAYEEWGVRCVDHFRGMFAFAVWDAAAERMFLARDRFGKKPLFIWEGKGTVLFGSEIKALLAFPAVRAEVDFDAVSDYLSYRYVPAPATLFKHIRKLMPGSYAIWEKGVLTECRYYQPPDGMPMTATRAPDDVVGAFLIQLEESVRIRMVSDVPFGAFLSGGIDSSAVVGLMARHSSYPVKTYSVGFSNQGYSELRYAAEIAKRFHTEHHELTVSVDQLMDFLPALVRYRDAPVAEPSDIPIYLLACEASRTVKMVLTGEGADELLGGYPKHVFERFASPYQRIPAAIRHRLVEPLVRAMPYRFRRMKTAAVNLGLESFEERMPRWFGTLSHDEKRTLVAFKAPQQHQAAAAHPGMGGTTLRRILFFDQTSWLPDNLLERGDRMTMAASLEARMPFVDQFLAEFVSRLPDCYRIRGRTTKWILREAMKRVLPASILERPKVGFRVPVNEWFRHSMRDYLYAHLTGPDSQTAHYYHKTALQKVLADHVAGRQNHEKLLWTLLTLELWHREYVGSNLYASARVQ
ncbi:MAG: asnB [Herminiimonas sp.]|nr:asnB [Herminiimonas sp.]MDB5852734.1 asnB [Herminiimonas sp.]